MKLPITGAYFKVLTISETLEYVGVRFKDKSEDSLCKNFFTTSSPAAFNSPTLTTGLPIDPESLDKRTKEGKRKAAETRRRKKAERKKI